MGQYPKEEIKRAILEKATELFYEKDFNQAGLREIAQRCNITPGLVYTYYENKEVLFGYVVSGVIENLESALLSESWWNDSFDGINEGSLSFILDVYREPMRFVILMDKSKGTHYEHAKSDLIRMIGVQISRVLRVKNKRAYDPIFIHMLSHHFAESLIEIARQFKTLSWAKEMLLLTMKAYFGGIKSL